MIKPVKTKNGTIFHTLHFYKGQRSKQRSTGTGTLLQAERIDRARQAEFEAVVDGKQAPANTFTPLSLDLFCEWKTSKGKKKELYEQYNTGDTRRYFDHLGCIEWNFKHVTVEQREHYVEVRRAQITRHKRPPFYRSLRRELSFLNWGLKAAKRKGYDITLDLEMPYFPREEKCEKRRGHYIHADDLNRWLEFLEPEYADQAYAQVCLGLRNLELRRFQLDFIRTFTPRATPGVVAYADMPGWACKWGKPRTIALTQPAYDALKRIIPVNQWQRTKPFQRGAKAAGLARAPHERDLRTTFANVAAVYGGDESGLDKFMGHQDDKMRAEYQAAYDERLAKIALEVAAQHRPRPADKKPMTLRVVEA